MPTGAPTRLSATSEARPPSRSRCSDRSCEADGESCCVGHGRAVHGDVNGPAGRRGPGIRRARRRARPVRRRGAPARARAGRPRWVSTCRGARKPGPAWWPPGSVRRRALAAGDVLPVGRRRSGPAPSARVAPAMPRRRRGAAGASRPHDALFRARGLETLCSARFTITPQSNRMAYRLEGAGIRHAGAPICLSDATPVGALQVPPSGLPILLMAERQTTGGYPESRP